MAKPPSSRPGKTEFAKIYEGLDKAGLGGFRIASMHLVPLSPAGAGAPDPGDACHAEQLPNGHWVIVCD